MARKALIGLLAASFFGCEDGCREAQKKLEETPLSSDQIPTMVSDNSQTQIAASNILPQIYGLGISLMAKQEAQAVEEQEEPNAITSPIEQMISYYEANESPSISFRRHRKITLNTEYERQGKAEIQQILIDNEYLDTGHAVEGCFDADTIKAVKKFQKENGLSQDGVVGYTTIPLLEEISDLDVDENHYAFSLDSACELNEDDHELISEIESALNFHHYAGLTVDGELDDATIEAIRYYKRRNLINNSDSIDSALVEHLSTSSSRRIDRLKEALATMNSLRRRRQPDTENHIYVNLAETQVRFYYNNNLEFQMDIIIGQKGKWKTDIQSGSIRQATVNPWWNVPVSIYSEQKRILRRDRALRQVTEQLNNGRWVLINDNSVSGSDFRQRPGPLNPFGRIYYDFNGPEGELLHGTAKHYLFRNNVRLYSHGCMRLHNEYDLFHTFQRLGILDDTLNVEEMVQETGSDGLFLTQRTQLVEPVPVNVIYVRAWVDSGENGLFMTMPKDIYGYGESKVRR
ncbi:MAG: L,D-transpeptidase family protein [Nanoarchaeota archaeon]|nr:L,D-transpeptidase family protein [Nanoarchaeota archaeon]